MDELRDMTSRVNSLEGIKEKYKQGIIENFRYVYENRKEIAHNGVDFDPIENLRRYFSSVQYNRCFDNSLGSNDRWGIVGKKNFFGLKAEFAPEDKEQDGILFLKAMPGRFQMQKFPIDIFPNEINITDILKREDSEQFREVEEFYNMTNREVFEKYGIDMNCDAPDGRKNLIADCVVLDSLLQGMDSDMKDVFCWSPQGYVINIKLEDGTEINAGSIDHNGFSDCERGITIKKDGKEARVDFDAINIGEKPNRLTNINDLEVENVVYTGDSELITKLKQAMQEQFKSQQEITEDKVETTVEPNGEPIESKSEQPVGEKIGAEQIIDFMKQNNLGAHDLSLALTMILARTTDRTNAEQHIVSEANKETEKSENNEHTLN